VKQGDLYLDDDENEDAVESYTKALNVDPNCEEAREGLCKLGREVPASAAASAPPPPPAAAGAGQKTFCAGCGTELAPGAKFCPSCGAAAPAAQPQKAFCANCGTEMTGAKFCPSCGTPAGGLAPTSQQVPAPVQGDDDWLTEEGKNKKILEAVESAISSTYMLGNDVIEKQVQHDILAAYKAGERSMTELAQAGIERVYDPKKAKKLQAEIIQYLSWEENLKLEP
jgi:hypothetical protein